jgi:iron complex outermembrane receptor protein
MTVISREQIEASPARTVPDILTEQTGINIHDFFGNNASTTTVDMRGFGITGAQNTLVLVDGRRVNDIDLSGVQWSAMPLSRDRAHRDRARRRQRALRRRRDGGRDQYHHAIAGTREELRHRGSAGSYGTHEGTVEGVSATTPPRCRCTGTPSNRTATARTITTARPTAWPISAGIRGSAISRSR